MTFDDAIEAFATSESMPVEQIQWVLDEWATTAADCRSLLTNYLDGKDWSERTEQALYVVILLLAEKADTVSFPDLCRLAIDTDRCNSVLGEGQAQIILPAALIDTFDGDSSALYRIVETSGADTLIRGEVLVAVAYLVRTNRVPESEFYQYLSHLPDKLPPGTHEYVWIDWIRAIAMLGFAGLSNQVEQILQRKAIDPTLMDSATFWEDLRTAQAAPNEMVGPAWDVVGPIGSAIEFLQTFGEEDSDDTVYEEPPEPIRNPLRNVGRNDPCPCGSGKKFKKCCLAA